MQSGLKSPAFLTLLSSLDELLKVAQSLNDEQFARAGISPFKSSIGAHFRHCLDHCNALLRSLVAGVADYETRIRSTEVETNRALAISSLFKLQFNISDPSFSDEEDSKSLLVTAASVSECRGIKVQQCQSTWGREMFFVASHTVHHVALVKIQASLLGVEFDPKVGLGLGTKKWSQEVAQCAP